jgi:hypothetical protein
MFHALGSKWFTSNPDVHKFSVAENMVVISIWIYKIYKRQWSPHDQSCTSGKKVICKKIGARPST